MENRPTKKQKELLSFIDGFIKGNGYGPSYREIMRALDYKSVSTVATHIDGLIARGWLIKKDNSARTLEVVGEVETKPVATKVAGSAKTAEQVIREKIDELATQPEANAEQLATLKSCLEILRYETKPELA